MNNHLYHKSSLPEFCFALNVILRGFTWEIRLIGFMCGASDRSGFFGRQALELSLRNQLHMEASAFICPGDPLLVSAALSELST